MLHVSPTPLAASVNYRRTSMEMNLRGPLATALRDGRGVIALQHQSNVSPTGKAFSLSSVKSRTQTVVGLPEAIPSGAFVQ